MRCRQFIGTPSAVENALPCPLCTLGNPVDFHRQLINFQLNHISVSWTIGAIRRLNGQFAHTLKDIGNFNHSPLSRIDHRLPIRGVTNGHTHTLNVRINSCCHSHASRIIRG